MKTTATNRRLRELLTDIRDGVLIPRPEFQRRLVWAMRHKNAFIKTVLEGLPFPEIYIASGDVDVGTGKGTLQLVDGQQRLSTLLEYFSGSRDLRLTQDIKPYEKLERDEKLNFLEYEVVVRDLGQMPIEEMKEVFRRINSTAYSLNAMELHNARYDGEFKRLAEELSQDEFFEKNRFFSANEIRRMSDVRFVISLMITMISTYYNREDEVENYLKKYNDEFRSADVVRNRFRETINYIREAQFPPGSRIWQKADFFTAFVEIDFVLKGKEALPSPETVRQRLDAFYSIVENNQYSIQFPAIELIQDKDNDNEDDSRERMSLIVADAAKYRRAALQATNDRSNRIARGSVIKKVINWLY